MANSEESKPKFHGILGSGELGEVKSQTTPDYLEDLANEVARENKAASITAPFDTFIIQIGKRTPDQSRGAITLLGSQAGEKNSKKKGENHGDE